MTVSSRAFAAMLKIGPPVTREVTAGRDVPVRSPDGADLLTDVYLAGDAGAAAGDPAAHAVRASRCDVRDEHGQPARLTPHQWRHTLGTRLINMDVPQEVVRRILDHDSHAMTQHSRTATASSPWSRPVRMQILV
jgi:integrase